MKINETTFRKVNWVMMRIIGMFAGKVCGLLMSLSRGVGILDVLCERKTILISINVEVALSTSENIGWKARIAATNQIEWGISNGINGARSVSKRDGFI